MCIFQIQRTRATSPGGSIVRIFGVHIHIFVSNTIFDFWNLDIPSFFAKQLCVLVRDMYIVLYLFGLYDINHHHSVFHTDAFDMKSYAQFYFSS